MLGHYINPVSSLLKTSWGLSTTFGQQNKGKIGEIKGPGMWEIGTF